MEKPFYQRWRMDEEGKAKISAFNKAANSRGQAFGAFYSKPMAAGVGGALALTAAYNILNSNDQTDLNPVMTALAGAGAGAAWGRHRQGNFGKNMMAMRQAIADVSVRPEADLEGSTAEGIGTGWAMRQLEGLDTLGQIPKPDPVEGWAKNSQQQASTWLANVMAGGERGRMMREISRMKFSDDADVLAKAFELAQSINAKRAAQSAAEVSGSVPKSEPAPATTADRGSPVPQTRVDDLHKGVSDEQVQEIIDLSVLGIEPKLDRATTPDKWKAALAGAHQDFNDQRQRKFNDALNYVKNQADAKAAKRKALTTQQVQAQEQAELVQQAAQIEQQLKPEPPPEQKAPEPKQKRRQVQQRVINANDPKINW